MDLLRTLVERIRQHHQQQQMNIAEGDGDTIAVIAVQPLEGHGPFPMSGEHSAEEMGGNREPAIIDDPMDIPIQIHPPMTPPHHRAGGPSRPFGPWPSDDYYNNVPFYPDYHQYPDSPTDGFEGHHGPRHNGPPPPPFDAREFFNGPEPHYPDFSPEQFANGPPPPPFDHRGPRNGPRRPFNRPPPPDYSDFADGPFAGRNGPPPPPFDHHSIDYPSDGPNGLNDGPFGGPPPPPHFGSFQGPPPAFGSFGGPEGPREEQSGSQQQPTIRITQHFTDKESDRPTSIVTEIFGGKKMERMVGEIIANSAMSGMNAIEQPQEGQNDQLLPPWMQRQFGPNTVDPAMIQGSPNGNPFFPTPNQMQMFNPFQAMNEIQYRPEGAMNQFNFAPPEISQQQFEMNLNQAQPPVQSAPFFHGANFMQQQQQTGQFRPEMAPFFAQNDQNEMMFANGAFPMGNNQQQGAQQPSGMGNGVMFPRAV
uniref:Uncharacterized protein n=1 Tax=Plectus sambesii TaxID=2011161 RepID=A0A914XFQ7_9BILA